MARLKQQLTPFRLYRRYVIEIDGEIALQVPSRTLWRYLTCKGLLTMPEINGETVCILTIKPETLINHCREYLQRPLLWRLFFHWGLVQQPTTLKAGAHSTPDKPHKLT